MWSTFTRFSLALHVSIVKKFMDNRLILSLGVQPYLFIYFIYFFGQGYVFWVKNLKWITTPQPESECNNLRHKHKHTNIFSWAINKDMRMHAKWKKEQEKKISRKGYLKNISMLQCYMRYHVNSHPHSTNRTYLLNIKCTH